MWKFILCSFLFLAACFYVLSGGSEFQAPEQEERAGAANTLATYDVPEGSTQVVPTLVASAPSVADATNAETQEVAQSVTPSFVQPADAPEVEEVLASSPRPQARVAAELTIVAEETGSGETFTPSVTTATVEVSQAANVDVRQVSGDRVNMRNGPSTDYNVVSQLSRGTQVEVLETPGNGWVRLKVADSGEIGWMAERLLTR